MKQKIAALGITPVGLWMVYEALGGQPAWGAWVCVAAFVALFIASLAGTILARRAPTSE